MDDMRSRAHRPPSPFVAALLLSLLPQSAPLDARAVGRFVTDLQRLVARDDRAAVARLISYPLIVYAAGIRIPIADADALARNYDVVFSPALKATIAGAAIAGSGPRAGAPSIAIADGVALVGRDVLTIAPVGSDLKITKITVPIASPDAAPARTPSATNRAGGRAPDRLGIAVGRVQRSGSLAPGERDAYLLSANRNQLIDVRIIGVAGRDIVARIANMQTGAAVDARARDGVRTWVGRMPADGDYRIDVVRLAPGARPMQYVMVVTLQ